MIRRRFRWALRAAQLLVVLAIGPLLAVACGSVKLGQDWRTADRSSAGIAPAPADTPEAVVQAYAARAFNWNGVFAVHTWISTKQASAGTYKVHEVVGYRQRMGLPVLASRPDLPDRLWYGARPQTLLDVRGERAEALIPAIEAAVDRYPHPDRYVLWPGPNSNTFVAFVAREVPELGLELPNNAIGKDYLVDDTLFARAPSGTGYQVSLFGLAGITAALSEGLEINLLSLNFGIDPLVPALKLPGIGRLGLQKGVGGD